MNRGRDSLSLLSFCYPPVDPHLLWEVDMKGCRTTVLHHSPRCWSSGADILRSTVGDTVSVSETRTTAATGVRPTWARGPSPFLRTSASAPSVRRQPSTVSRPTVPPGRGDRTPPTPIRPQRVTTSGEGRLTGPEPVRPTCDLFPPLYVFLSPRPTPTSRL